MLMPDPWVASGILAYALPSVSGLPFITEDQNVSGST